MTRPFKSGLARPSRRAFFWAGTARPILTRVWTEGGRVTGGSLPAEIWQTFMREAIRSDKDFKRDLEETDVLPANPRKSGELIQIATDTLGGAATVSQRSNRASKPSQTP